ncbi:hypothetical protein ACFZBM_01230 [Streptomyces lavendulae]
MAMGAEPAAPQAMRRPARPPEQARGNASSSWLLPSQRSA